MTNITLHPGDNRASLRRLIEQGVRVHSVVTDPPYGLVSIQKRFGKEGSAPARREKNDGSFARLSGGFMGRAWDGTGIERDPEFWKLIYDILLPGGYVFAFSGSRTGHWQACAMEMAGFIMHPMHGWCFGSGFPKAHAADKAIDKHLGIDREVVGTRDPRSMYDGRDRQSAAINTHWRGAEGRDDVRDLSKQVLTVPGSPEAAEWEGWAYGTQAQKPALEPIYLGQKPFDCKTGAANLLKHGVGAVNIDRCRVGWPDGKAPEIGTPAWGGPQKKSTAVPGQEGETKDRLPPSPSGRHPANLILDGSPEVVAMFPAKAGAAAPVKGTEPSGVTKDIYGKFNGRTPGTFFNDEGSAARFFHQFPLTDEDYEHAIAVGVIGEDRGAPLIYNGKAGKADRAGSSHPTVKPIALMQYLIRHITPPGGIVLDPFAGSGTTAEAARREGFDCILMEAETEYVEFLGRRFPEVNDYNQKMLLSDELLAENSFTVCSHPERKGLNSYLSDLIGENVDLSDLI
ncbi:site-specific DNA-methyltransferase [Rhizobium pusense]|uniref:DNA methyltransferase n=1 Tax=Agrobacterium pusense TaxID=648995 RepID=UPI002448690A|nr:DNA methyltransferase [Agrobacterium pusense]MDH1266723.1 site-specific DNA-methyltransferase [Agrobacterium pusense]